MMGLYIDGSRVTRFIRVTPQSNVTRITNKLLDGSLHIQIIGSASNTLNIDLFVDAAGKQTIDAAEASGTTVSIYNETGDYNGIIVDKKDWIKPAEGLFETSIILSIEAVV